MKKILILGAGTGGSIVANILARKIDELSISITVIDRCDIHYYQPGLLFIPFKLYGYEGGADITKPVSEILSQKVDFIKAEIDLIDHQNKIVSTSKGEYEYDWLICSLGCHIDWSEIEGCQQAIGKGVHTFYTLPSALNMQVALEKMERGHLVVDIAQVPIKCPVAPIEAVFLADYYFQLRGIRDDIDISLVTPYSGAFTKPNANKVLTRIAEEKNINIISDFELEKIDTDNKLLIAYGGKTIAYDMACVIPPTLGPDVISKSGLGNDMNYALTDPRTLKSRKAENIFFMGDNADVPTSKAGSVSHFEAETIIENLLREMKGEKSLPSFDGHSNCYIESGHHKALLVDFNYDIEPLHGKFPIPNIGPFSLLEDTYINHLGKMSFRWIYWNLIVSGSMPDMPFVPAHMSLVGKDLDTAAPFRKATNLTVSNLMTRDVITAGQGTSVKSIAAMMQDHNISGIPVVNPDDELIGIITTADLICSLDIDQESVVDKFIATAIRKGRSKKIGSVVEDIMTPGPVTVHSDTNVVDAIKIMNHHKINRLIISDDNKAIIGVLSRTDILNVYH